MCVVVVAVCVFPFTGRCVYTSFFCTHTPPPLSCDRVDDDEVLQGGDRQLWQKRLLRMPCAYVCVPEERQKCVFPQHQRPAHHREVERGVFFFQVENRERQRELLCVCATCPCFISQKRILRNCLALYYLGNERKDCNQMCK